MTHLFFAPSRLGVGTPLDCISKETRADRARTNGENDETRMVRAGLALNDEGMQLSCSCSCSSPARENNFLLGFLIRRDRARIFQVVAIKPRRKRRRQISNQIAGGINDPAEALFHNGPDSLAQAIGHPLSDRGISRSGQLCFGISEELFFPTSRSTLPSATADSDQHWDPLIETAKILPR